jgi:UDP-N-acetyl-D-mannosaminuronic acid transferase (WecB/TagA/CpsF family)
MGFVSMEEFCFLAVRKVASTQDGYHQENKQQKMLARISGKRKAYTLLVGM